MISTLRKHFVICILHILFQLHSMILLIYQHPYFFLLLCHLTQGSILSNPILTHTLGKTLLGNWCQRGRESSHQSLIISKRGKSAKLSHQERPQLLGIQRGENLHVFRGERHVHVVFVCALLWFSIPYLLPISHIRFRESKTSKGRKSSNSLHIFTFGDMYTLKEST